MTDLPHLFNLGRGQQGSVNGNIIALAVMKLLKLVVSRRALSLHILVSCCSFCLTQLSSVISYFKGESTKENEAGPRNSSNWISTGYFLKRGLIQKDEWSPGHRVPRPHRIGPAPCLETFPQKSVYWACVAEVKMFQVWQSIISCLFSFLALSFFSLPTEPD